MTANLFLGYGKIRKCRDSWYWIHDEMFLKPFRMKILAAWSQDLIPAVQVIAQIHSRDAYSSLFVLLCPGVLLRYRKNPSHEQNRAVLGLDHATNRVSRVWRALLHPPWQLPTFANGPIVILDCDLSCKQTRLYPNHSLPITCRKVNTIVSSTR